MPDPSGASQPYKSRKRRKVGYATPKVNPVTGGTMAPPPRKPTLGGIITAPKPTKANPPRKLFKTRKRSK